MANAHWKGLDGWHARMRRMKAQATAEFQAEMVAVGKTAATAAKKAASKHRKSGRLDASIRPYASVAGAGYEAVFYVRANRALKHIREKAIKAAHAKVKADLPLLGKRITR